MAVADNIVDYYKLDGNSNDSVGSNNGTDTDITYSNGNGKINNGAGFNGTSSKIMLTNGELTAFTVSFWVKFTAFGAALSIIDKYIGAAEGFRIWAGTNWSGFLLTTRGATNTNWSVAWSPSLDVWYHVTWTYDSGTALLYIDGNTTPVDTKTGLTMTSSSGTLAVGVNNAGSGSYLDGCLDEIGVWSRALSSSEVEKLYNSGNGLQYPFPSTSVSSSPSSSPSPSVSPSTSPSPSISPSTSPSSSVSSSLSASPSISESTSPSSSESSSISLSPSSSLSLSPSSSLSESPSSSMSTSPSPSVSPSTSPSSSESSSISSSPSISPSSSLSTSPSSSLSSSPSISISSSISSSPSPSPSPGYIDYTRGSYETLPADDADLSTVYSAQDVIDVALVDSAWVDQATAGQNAVHQYKNYAEVTPEHNECIIRWTGQTDYTGSPVYLQIYNQNTATWETINQSPDLYDSPYNQYDSDNNFYDGFPANTDFVLSASITDLTNYKNAQGVVSCRVHQEDTLA